MDMDKDMLALACAKMVHELKNPLTLVANTLQLVELEFPSVASNKYWNKISDELNYINLLLNDFNSLSSHGRLTLIPLDLGEIVAEVCDQFYPLCAAKSITLTLDMPDELLIIVSDEIKLLQIISNIIKNAIEAASKDGHVNVYLSSGAQSVELEIKDDGCGISEDQLPNIFNPFVTYKENGTGLGLSIVASNIEQLNGTIKVASTLGIGTKFTLSFTNDTNGVRPL